MSNEHLKPCPICDQHPQYQENSLSQCYYICPKGCTTGCANVNRVQAEDGWNSAVKENSTTVEDPGEARQEALMHAMPTAITVKVPFERTGAGRDDRLQVTRFHYRARDWPGGKPPQAEIGITDDVPLDQNDLAKVTRDALTLDVARFIKAGLQPAGDVAPGACEGCGKYHIGQQCPPVLDRSRTLLIVEPGAKTDCQERFSFHVCEVRDALHGYRFDRIIVAAEISSQGARDWLKYMILPFLEPDGILVGPAVEPAPVTEAASTQRQHWSQRINSVRFDIVTSTEFGTMSSSARDAVMSAIDHAVDAHCVGNPNQAKAGIATRVVKRLQQCPGIEVHSVRVRFEPEDKRSVEMNGRDQSSLEVSIEVRP